MRVLMVHNRYRSALPSGENRVVDDEVAMLRNHGVEVETFMRSSDDIPTMGLARRASLPLQPLISSEIPAFTDALSRFRPDIVHLHNPYPLISPWVIRVAHRRAVPVVQTVQNFRHVCVAGTFFRNGTICEDCSGRSLPWPSVMHGCYRGSRPQSMVMAAALAMHRSTWLLVDHFLPANGFIAQQLQSIGIPAARLSVKPNAVIDPGVPAPLGRDLLFVGRLEAAKGVRLLLQAWRTSSAHQQASLIVAGDGPERTNVERATELGSVRYVGLVDGASVAELMRSSAVLVVPSLWYEGFPRVVVEAFAQGRPVVATSLGGLGEIIDEQVGWTSPPEPVALGERLALACDRQVVATKAKAARHRYEESFTPRRIVEQLMTTYSDVVRQRRSRG